MSKEKSEVFLPNEIIHHISTFFQPPWQKNTARRVCQQWKESIIPCRRFFILGSPVLVQEKQTGKDYAWKEQFTAEEIHQSFTKIPNNGFIVFNCYQDAYLYAHTGFTEAKDDPNFNQGIHGTGCLDLVSLTSENKAPFPLYHPVVFEVVYDNDRASDLIWHNLAVYNLGGSNARNLKLSAIRESSCKDKLQVLSSRIALGFLGDKPIEPIVLYDSKAHPCEKEEEVADQGGRCLVM